MNQIEIKVEGSEEDMRRVMFVLADAEEKHDLCLITGLSDSVNEDGECKYCGADQAVGCKMACETRRWSL